MPSRDATFDQKFNFDFNAAFAANGGNYVSGTTAATGYYVGTYAHTTCVISALTCDTTKWYAGTPGTAPTSITIPQGAFFQFPGTGATSITLASGTATHVNA